MSEVITRILCELRKNVINIPIDNDVICTICKEIMINARSAPCGCRYCFDCISKYLNGENKYCPGQTSYCHAQMISLNVNTHNDYGINRKISRMIVKCPAVNCKFIDEVKDIETHMQICSFNASQTNIDSENKIRSLEKKIENNESKIKELEEVIETLKIDETEKQTRFLEMETDSNNCFNKIKQIEKEIVILSNKLRIIDDPEMRMISCKDWKNMTDPIHQKMEDSFHSQKKEINIMMDRVKEIEDIQNELKVFIEHIKSKLQLINSAETEENSISECPEKTAKNNLGIHKTYPWVIDKFFSNVKPNMLATNQTISSDSFYTHKTGYKLHLELDLNVYSSGLGTPIYISYCLMEGDYDDQLLWPCKFNVRFDLINPYNNKLYCSSIISNNLYSAHPGTRKPFIESFPVGCRLAKFEDIFQNKDWRKCDKIIINCTVSFDKY